MFLEGFLQSRRLIDDSNQGALSAARTNLPPVIAGAAESSVAAGSQSTLVYTATDVDGLNNFTCSICSQESVTCTTSGQAGATEMTVTIQATFATSTSFYCTAYDVAGAPAVVQPTVVVTGTAPRSVTGTISPWSIIIPSAVGGVLLSVLLGLCCCCLLAARKRRENDEKEEDSGAAPYGAESPVQKNPLDVYSPRTATF